MTCRRLSMPSVALLLTLNLAEATEAQSLLGAPPVDPTPTSTFIPRATPMFAARQIVDRPTADLRPRFHWGVYGSVIPKWSIPGSMGNLFFEDEFRSSPKMEGRDLRIGLVRGRQLGFEMGGSFVRTTVTSLKIVSRDVTNSGSYPTVTYTVLNPVQMTGLDSHIVIPIKKIGERVQLGILAGGGVAWVPDTAIQAQIEGPPFYANATSTVPLSSPPASGGFVCCQYRSLENVPLVPGTRYGIAEEALSNVSSTGPFRMLLRGHLAADFLLAPPLKLRVATGFNFPGVQALGIDVVYLFRTGRVGTGPGQPQPGPVAASPVQIADRPQVIAPRRWYWGVLAGAAPQWWMPESWVPFFEPDDPTVLEGREFRIGITRGRPLGYEFGVSFVRKSLTRFSIERAGMPVFDGSGNFSPQVARITLTNLEPVQVPGADFHALVPIARIGSRVQIGALLSLGGVLVPDTLIEKRIEGPPFFASATSVVALATLPAGGGFVVDDHDQRLPVAPGQTGAVFTVSGTEIKPLGRLPFLARGQIAADVLVAAPLKLRFSAGWNYPGVQLFGIEMVYLFGTGGN